MFSKFQKNKFNPVEKSVGEKNASTLCSTRTKAAKPSGKHRDTSSASFSDLRLKPNYDSALSSNFVNFIDRNNNKSLLKDISNNQKLQNLLKFLVVFIMHA